MEDVQAVMGGAGMNGGGNRQAHNREVGRRQQAVGEHPLKDLQVSQASAKSDITRASRDSESDRGQFHFSLQFVWEFVMLVVACFASSTWLEHLIFVRIAGIGMIWAFSESTFWKRWQEQRRMGNKMFTSCAYRRSQIVFSGVPFVTLLRLLVIYFSSMLLVSVAFLQYLATREVLSPRSEK